MSRVHAPSCPDPDEHLGEHEVCPCPKCLGTGLVDGDLLGKDCDCGLAEELSIEERVDLVEKIYPMMWKLTLDRIEAEGNATEDRNP